MKRKKLLPLLLSAAMVVTMFPTGSLTVQAAGTSSSKMKVSDKVKADVDKTKFTHKEWTGTDYQDVNGKEVTGEDVFGINREDASTVLIPYQNADAAKKAVWNYNARTESSYFQLLTGEENDWDLTVVQNQEEAEKFMGKDGFMTEKFQPEKQDGWKTVQLPQSWTTQGFDKSIYTNTQMPWQTGEEGTPCPEAPTKYNPVGLYRKTFQVNQAMRDSGRRIYLDFQGVESAYYVYVNGKEVGYSEDTFSPHRFDITDYLKDGENLLAVKVHKFCDGTWFEDQDMIYDGGIFRDVYLTSAPLVQISDYVVQTDLDSEYKDATLNLSVDVRNLSNEAQKGWTIDVAAFDEAGKNILGETGISVDEVVSNKTKTFNLSQKVENPKLWSAENPNLYALVLTLRDGNGKEVETVSTQLGFREVEFTSTKVDSNYKVLTKKWDPIRINGQNLLLKGANRHDTDPFYGKAVPQATMEEDVKLMKQNNLNAIRTSHYSNDEYLYWLCNTYGLYMMGETNMECHAIQSDSERAGLFYELGMDRTETAFKRLRNNPSIVMWSIGNEMAYTQNPNDAKGLYRDMIWYFKDNDATRPVHSEGQTDAMGVDMGSNMYPGVDTVQSRAGEGKIPYVMCEYVHGMGNSVGNLKEYWDAVRSADNMLGGFVWDWVDQSRTTDLKEGAWDYYAEDYAYTNLYKDEVKGKFYGYGGDWGDVPNDNSFCQNGILSADRTPQPELAEVKYQYQDFWFSADVNNLNERKVNVYNESNFTNLNKYKVTWELLENGKKIDAGVVENTDVAPRTTGTIDVPFNLPKEIPAGSEYYLNISVSLKEAERWAEKGAEMSWGQIAVPVEVKQAAPAVSEKEVTVSDETDGYAVEGENFSFTIDKKTGILKNYVYDGETLIKQGPTPNFWRGRLENDKDGWYSGNTFDWGWEKVEKNIKVESVTASEKDGQHVITAELVFPDGGNTKETIVYTINGDGQVTVNMKVDPTKSGMGNMLRVGSRMTLPEGFENVTWYGNGPVETFNDRKTNGRQGIWENTVNRFFYPYLRVDDSGNLTDVKWISVENPEMKNALLVAAKDTVEAQALHYTPDELNAVEHVYELQPQDGKETYLNVNYGSSGTGGATCGPATLVQYRLPSNRVYEWEFTMIPVSKDADTEEISNLAKTYHTVDVFDQAEYDAQVAADIIKRVDEFVVYDYSQLKEVEKLQADYNALTDTQKKLVNEGKDRAALIKKYVEGVKALESQETYLQDESKNNMKIPYQTTAKFTNCGEGVVMSGQLQVPYNNILTPVFSGDDTSFTVEVNAIPTAYSTYDMFAGKGDYAFALRAREESVDFHVFADGNWRALECKMTPEFAENWLGKEHQIVGVYDAQTDKIAVYVDGVLLGEKETDKGVDPSDYNLTVGGCPETGRGSTAEFKNIHVYNKALTAAEVKGQYAETPAIGKDSENVELWVDLTDIKHREKANIYDVSIEPDLAVVKAGTTKEFKVVPDNAEAVVENAQWSVADENGKAIKGMDIVEGDDGTATLIVGKNVADRTKAKVIVSNVNGKETLTAEAEVTVQNAEEKQIIKDESKNKLNTKLPETAQFVNGEQGKETTLKGHFTVDDEKKIVNAAMTNGKPFTVSSRVYVPASCKSDEGNFDGNGDKHNMIASLGDGSFAYRIFHKRGSAETRIDAFISDGSGWNMISSKALADDFFDKWHEISVAYTRDTLKLYVDGTELVTGATTLKVADNEFGFSVGYAPQVTSRTSDLTFEQVRVFSEALTTDELNNAAEPANDNVVLWLNFDGRLEDDIATDVDKRMLEALVDYCLSLESGDYLEAGWSAMQKPLETAKTVLADKQATRKEVADAEKALSEAKEALVYVKDLKDAIDVADKEIVPNKDKYTKDSYKVFSDALKEAKAIRNKKDATQAEVNKAKITLLDAQNALVNIADKSDLSKAIKDAEQLLKKESLTPSSEQELKAAIEAAKKVNDDENATQEAVDAATEALKEAMGAIRTMADFKELEKTVNRIDEMKLDKYTEESVQILKKALADAKAVLANKESTQKEVDDALSTLLAAEKGLVKKQDGGNNGGNNGGSNGGNNQNNGNHGNPNRPVKTGDTSPVMAFGLAAVATGLAGAVAMYTKRRKRS